MDLQSVAGVVKVQVPMTHSSVAEPRLKIGEAELNLELPQNYDPKVYKRLGADILLCCSDTNCAGRLALYSGPGLRIVQH